MLQPIVEGIHSGVHDEAQIGCAFIVRVDTCLGKKNLPMWILHDFISGNTASNSVDIPSNREIIMPLIFDLFYIGSQYSK